MYLPKGRRRLIAGSVALAMLAAGCSADNEDSPTDPSEDGAFQITESLPPASGPVESVTWTVSSEPDQLDPARRARNIPSETVRAAICESLWRITPDRKLEPALAVSVDSPDPTTFVYQLREGVRFNDGTEMTADDVVASLSRHLDPEVGSVVADAFKNVESIEATGPLEVTVTLSKPDYLFNQQMAGEAGRVESAAFLHEAGADYGSPDFGLNCTGPFKFEHWEVGNSITLVRNDDYWDDDNPPLAERFTFIFPTDGSARINALVAGEIDGGYNVPEGASRTLLAADSGNLYFGPGTQAYSMIANQSGILGDIRVRRAISLALDRQGAITAGFDGFGSVARVPIGQYGLGGAGPGPGRGDLPVAAGHRGSGCGTGAGVDRRGRRGGIRDRDRVHAAGTADGRARERDLRRGGGDRSGAGDAGDGATGLQPSHRQPNREGRSRRGPVADRAPAAARGPAGDVLHLAHGQRLQPR